MLQITYLGKLILFANGRSRSRSGSTSRNKECQITLVDSKSGEVHVLYILLVVTILQGQGLDMFASQRLCDLWNIKFARYLLHFSSLPVNMISMINCSLVTETFIQPAHQ